MKPLKTPLIIAVILIASSFIPVLQILILQIDGLIIAGINLAIEKLSGTNNVRTEKIANLILSLIFLVAYFASKRRSMDRLFLILLAFFLYPFFVYSLEGISEINISLGGFDLYFLPIIIYGLMVSTVLILAVLLKNRLVKNRQ